MAQSIGSRVSINDTMTDRIAASIEALLENYRDELDRDGSLQSLFIRVRIDDRSGAVKEVSLSRESTFP